MLALTLILGASAVPAWLVVALIGAGVLIAIGGHAGRSQGAVVTGIVIVFIATAIMVLGAFAAYQSNPIDPRPAPAKGGF